DLDLDRHVSAVLSPRRPSAANAHAHPILPRAWPAVPPRPLPAPSRTPAHRSRPTEAALARPPAARARLCLVQMEGRKISRLRLAQSLRRRQLPQTRTAQIQIPRRPESTKARAPETAH